MYQQPEQPRQKIPKDGIGPRGVPDCYYTSRVLNSTFRYVKFVKKLRQEEEEIRRGKEIAMKELKEKQQTGFFIHCDRRSLINDVARRVDLCMQSYERDVASKRQRLKELLTLEEEANIRKFVEQAQAGAEQVWESKLERLKYLIQKRKEEHERKFKDTPLSKCAHVLPCIYKLRAKEAEEIQLYQIKEKEARKIAEQEFDKMWYAVAMKESDALAARMEQDAIERLRRDIECKEYTDLQLQQRREQREKERQMLIEEAKRFKSIWEEDNRKEEEAERMRTEKRMKVAAERDQLITERREKLEKQAAEEKMIDATWDSLANQGMSDELAKIELIKKKERDLVDSNRHIVRLKREWDMYDNDGADLVEEEAARQQMIIDKKRCEYKLWSMKTNKDCRVAMIQQIEDRRRAREDLKTRMEEQEEYSRVLYAQLQQLVKDKERREADARKRHQRHLLDQIEYNQLLKDRAVREELAEREKGKRAAEEYNQQIARMLSRPYFSDNQNAFVKQMATGLRMRETCPCSKPTYCKSAEDDKEK